MVGEGRGRNDRRSQGGRGDNRIQDKQRHIDKPHDTKESRDGSGKTPDKPRGDADGRPSQRRGGRQDRSEVDPDKSHGQDDMGASEAPGPAQPKKFTGRCRLFVGNLPSELTDEEFKSLFAPFGELSEVFVNPSKGFGFVRLETRAKAEEAKAGLDGQPMKGRTLRVRFATHGAAIRVKHLLPHVSNELLEEAFLQFGDIERAIVIVDDRGRSTGEGIVEFARKPGATAALNRISNGVFLMGASPRPIEVEQLEQKDDEDGLFERFMQKNPQFYKEREQSPRFAQPGSFEHDFALKWKELYNMEKQQQEQLKRQMKDAELKLEDEQEAAALEHQAMLLRQDVMRRQEELRLFEEQRAQDLQRRMEVRRREEEMRMRQEEQQRQQEIMMNEERMQRNQRGGGPSSRERQRDDLFNLTETMRLQQQALILEEEQRKQTALLKLERAFRGERGGNTPTMQPPPAPPANLMDQRGIEQRGGRMERSGMNMGSMGTQGMGNQGMGGGQGGQNQMGGSMGNNMRQSRFDQGPGQGGMGGGFGGNMSAGNMGGAQGMGGGGSMMGQEGGRGGMGRSGHSQMGETEGRRGGGGGAGERRSYGGRDEYENKRARRY